MTFTFTPWNFPLITSRGGYGFLSGKGHLFTIYYLLDLHAIISTTEKQPLLSCMIVDPSG